jgi:Leucine-rich repeat (LRR) protein
MGLVGNLPQEFARLRSLKALDLSRNKLAGTIPSAFGGNGSLSGLGELDLSRNLLTGPLPAEMRGLTELQKLDLSYNTFVVRGCRQPG